MCNAYSKTKQYLHNSILNSQTFHRTSNTCTNACSMFEKEHTTYNERLYLDEFMQRGVMGLLEIFTDVEEVNLRAGHHNTDESPVVCSQALQGKSVLRKLWPDRWSLRCLWSKASAIVQMLITGPVTHNRAWEPSLAQILTHQMSSTWLLFYTSVLNWDLKTCFIFEWVTYSAKHDFNQCL